MDNVFILYLFVLQKVKQSSSTAKVSGRVASLLEKIAEYPNVPRKRKKFEVSDQHVYNLLIFSSFPLQNFVRNSINVRDETTLSQVWEAFSEATKATAVPSQSNGDNKIEPASTPPPDVIATGTETEDKLTTHTSVLEVSELTKEKKKKSKKLKKCPMELEESTQQSMQEDDIKKKTKKSKKQAESKDRVDCCQLNGIVETVTMTSDDARKKKKKGKKDESVNTKEKRKRNHGDEDIQSRTKKLKRTD